MAAANGNGSKGAATYDYDLAVIGAGSGGVRAARLSAAAGAKVIICDLPFGFLSKGDHGGIGGTCVIRARAPRMPRLPFFITLCAGS